VRFCSLAKGKIAPLLPLRQFRQNLVWSGLMYMVYWTIIEETDARPHAQDFGTDEMVKAMGFMEDLRRRQRAGEGIRFITMCSEHPESVGHPGVDVTGPDYDWKKRRR
jgi:hypothetical protein